MIDVLYAGYNKSKKTVDTRTVLRGDCPKCKEHRMLSVRLRHNPEQDVKKAVVQYACGRKYATWRQRYLSDVGKLRSQLWPGQPLCLRLWE